MEGIVEIKWSKKNPSIIVKYKRRIACASLSCAISDVVCDLSVYGAYKCVSVSSLDMIVCFLPLNCEHVTPCNAKQ